MNQYNKNELMNSDLENSFLLVYLSGPLIITHGSRGSAPADPPLSGPAHAILVIGLNELLGNPTT
jgi:hypothetical protein